MQLKNFWQKTIKQYRSVLFLVGAVGFGALALFAGKNFMQQQLEIEKSKLQPKQALIDVVVSKADLPRGATIDNSNMAVRSIPAAYHVTGSIVPDKFESYIGSKLANGMRRGEPLIASALEGADVTTFSSKVKTGIRAMTISVDEVNSVSGMLQPGDRIDLLFSVRPPNSVPGAPQASEMTVPLMQDVIVLATGKQVRPGQGENPQMRTFTTVTIEVAPQSAQKLVVAQRSGKLTALLRNPGDRSPLSSAPMDVHGLLQLPTPKAPAIPIVAVPTEVIVGGKGALVQNAVAQTTPVAKESK